MDSQIASTADQAATIDSKSEERLQSDHAQDDVDFPNPPNADQATDTDSNSEDRHIFRLFPIPQNSLVEVKDEVLQYLIFLRSEELFKDDRFYGSYLSIVGGTNGDPDQVVLVETFESERPSDYGGCSDNGEAEMGDDLFVELEYYECYWGLVQSLISRGLLERGRVIDPDLEDGMELMEKLRGRKLWMYGVYL